MSGSSKPRLEVYTRNRQLIGILENVYGVAEELKINSINYLEFVLPYNDEKNELCEPFNLVRYKNGDLYRIMHGSLTITEKGDYKYRAEHVFALLIDDVLLNDHVVGNIGVFTRDVINYVLGFQTTTNWRLGICEFTRQFEYGWTDESVLSALMSIPNRFVDTYIWTFDTSQYPFVVHLRRIEPDALPDVYVREGFNRLQLVKTSDATTIATRIYPRGYGEGINKLTIERVNNGIDYIESPPEIIAKYGLVSRIWTDRRYTDPQQLKEAAEAMLHEMQEPFEQYTVGLSVLTYGNNLTPFIGACVDIVGFKRTYITGINWYHDEVPDTRITLANKPQDIASTVADMINRQRIEMTYAQGATQVWQSHWYDNADANQPLRLNVFIPQDLVIINWVRLQVEVGPFRMPFGVTGGGGSRSDTTAGGGSFNVTSGGGGGTTSTTTTTSSQAWSSTSQPQVVYSTTSEPQHIPTTRAGGANTLSSGDGGLRSDTTVSAPEYTATAVTHTPTESTTQNGGLITPTSRLVARIIPTVTSLGSNSTSTSSGGGINITSWDGGGTNTSTGGGGKSAPTSRDFEFRNPTTQISGGTRTISPSGMRTGTGTSSGLPPGGTLTQYPLSHVHEIHSWDVRLSIDHRHDIALPAHAHTIDLPEHSHGFSVPDHRHRLDLPDHAHDFTIPGHTHTVEIPTHEHTVSIPNHQHKYTVSPHSHNVTIRGHTHGFSIPNHKHSVNIPSHTHEIVIRGHSHTVTIPTHQHSTTIPGHQHHVTLNDHTHRLEVAAHSHSFTLPNHTHTLTPAITRAGNPTQFSIRVNGVTRLTVSGRNWDNVITEWLFDEFNMIPRNRNHVFEIVPNEPAYIQLTINIQGFIQSKGGVIA